MFRSYSNISKYFLRDYGTIAMVIILLTMVTITTMISSRVKITCYLHVWRYEVFAGKLTWYFTGACLCNKWFYSPVSRKISHGWARLFDDFSKILQKLFEGHTNVTNNLSKFPKIAKDFDFVEDEKMFLLYTRPRDKLDISEISDIFSSDQDVENTRPESRMWIPMNFSRGVF